MDGVEADIRQIFAVAEQCVRYKAVPQAIYCVLERCIQLVQMEKRLGLEPVVPEDGGGALIHIVFTF